MFTQKTKLQLCARNLTAVEYDLTAIDFTGIDLVGAVDHVANYAVGDYAIDLDGFSTMDIPVGCIIGFAGDDTSYYITLSEQRGLPGSGEMNIEIYPPLRAALLNNVVATIYPHFDITQYWTNDVFIEQQAEFQQAELILDRPLRIELFNKNSIFYDRDTHSTGWGLTTAYFSTYNAQAATDNQYIRISVSRNGGAWQQKYNGKIKQYTLELDEINHLISFECESVFYGLKDLLVSQIDELYYLHKYTSSSRKTKTPSGRYVDVIRALFKKAGVMPKSYTVTNKEKSNGFNLCVLTIGAHSIVAGELITVSIGDTNFDGTHIVSLVTSTTIYYYINSDPYGFTKDDVNATVAAGNSAFVLQAGLSPASSNYTGYCKISGDTQIYEFWYNSGTKTVNVTPNLVAEATINDDVYLSYPTIVASAAASGTVTAHRIYFDTVTGVPSDYFNVTHQGHTYNLLDLFWITEKWMVQDVEAETGFSLFQELCLQLGAVCNIDYIAGIAYGFFRSKINTSTSKVTLTSSKIIGQPKLNGNWPFYSADGVLCNAMINYWNGESQPDEFCYAENLNSGDYQRYLSETPSSSVLAYAKYSTTVNADSFNNLAVGDQIKFRNHDTIYKVTAVSGETITIAPGLTVSIKLGEKFHKISDNGISLSYANLCNLKLKYPNIFLIGDSTGGTFPAKVRKYYNNGTATLGIHPMSFYTSEIVNEPLDDGVGICFIKNSPVADGHMFIPNGDMLAIIADNGTNSRVESLKSKASLPKIGDYDLQDPQVVSGLNRVVHGYITTRDADNNSVSIFSVLMTSWLPTVGVDLQIGRISLDMQSYGEEATARVVVIPEIKRKKGTKPRFAGNFTDRTDTVTIRKGSSSNTAFANEFDLYRMSQRFYTQVFFATLGSYPGLIGTGSTVYSMCLNADVLNPDYDDMIYADANHAECIQKAACFSPTSATEVLTGTPPTAGTVYNFIVNHGESTAQEYYYYDSTNDRIKKNAGTAWTEATTIVDYDGAIIPVKWDTLYYSTGNIVFKMTAPVVIRKAYDNLLVVGDPTNLKLYIIDVDNDRVSCIEDTAVLDSIGDIDIQCFTNWWDYQGATNSNIFENDICFNASKLAYKFYSKNRRPYVVDTTDALIGYIDYSLFDRMTVDSGVLSAASGSPKFYVYCSRFNLRTHDHKLTLLESVE